MNSEKGFLTRTYTNKDGEVITKQYNQKEYNRAFYLKHKDEINEKIICECGGKYTSRSKIKHSKTKLHELYEKMKIEN